MRRFDLSTIHLTKYLFFTGKGGVGKTSISCATAVTLADSGKSVLLISTDPASNLQDVFNTTLNNEVTSIDDVPNLGIVNIDPIEAAALYRESVVSPYRGLLPDSVIYNMEEQLSGSCTVEIAAFNEFTKFLADKEIENKYDYIIFDTAPTGHTLRMLQLPSAWNNFINESTHGASCLGQLSGLQEKKDIYNTAVINLCNKDKTTLFLVARPDVAPLKEVERASKELSDIGVNNQLIIINGLFSNADDEASRRLKEKQEKALMEFSKSLINIETYSVPFRAYNILGVNNVRKLLTSDEIQTKEQDASIPEMKNLNDIIDDLEKTNKKVIFTMGKGGVGKTTIARAIALGLAKRGKKVHLASTDPAHQLENQLSTISTSFIDEELELKKYTDEILSKAKESTSTDDLSYIEEDLRSPCTQEIAVFRAFASIVAKSRNEIVVIDTAPTGHTLLLLDSTLSYHKEVRRNQGEIPTEVRELLPSLRNKDHTEVIITTLAEATPVYEALRLEEDLLRAGINIRWWVINSSYFLSNSSNKIINSRGNKEIEWINKVNQHTKGNAALIKWHHEDMDPKTLIKL